LWRVWEVELAKLRGADAHIRAKRTPGGELADVGICVPGTEVLFYLARTNLWR
jgi:hypothetical protein